MDTLEKLMALGHSFQQLRTIEILDARRYAEMRDRCIDADAKAVLSEKIKATVIDARKWNRLSVGVKRRIQQSLFARLQAARAKVHQSEAVRLRLPRVAV